MNRLLSLIGSMKSMAFLMLIFAVSIGYATFIENDYGTMTAKADIYNARWFEVLLILLAINLITNIVRFKMYKKGKGLILLFHVSFLIILLGAGVTRYFGYEGMMHIRQGGSSNSILSAEPYVSVEVIENGNSVFYREPLFLSKRSKNHFNSSIHSGNEKIDLALTEYIPDAEYKPVASADGKPFVEVMVTGAMGAEQKTLQEGDFVEANDVVLDFNSGKHFDKPVIQLSSKNNQLYGNFPFAVSALSMDTQKTVAVSSGEHALLGRTLFQTPQSGFVIRSFIPHGVLKLVEVPKQSKKGPMMQANAHDALTFSITKGSDKKEVVVLGTPGELGEPKEVNIGGKVLKLSYGSIEKTLPFSLVLRKFELERYPGSMSPASYASEVTLIDQQDQNKFDFRIFMNHVLDYKGYRFFQSSFDRDEMGTVLSVNNDPGTMITYIGYFLLALGMFGTLLVKSGRFNGLNNKLKSLSSIQNLFVATLLIGAFASTGLHANDLDNPVIDVAKRFDKEHANKFGHLIVQDANGRMKPMDTLSYEIVAKLNRSNEFLGLNPNQIVLGMMLRPETWREIAIIHTADKEVNRLIGLPENTKNAAFSQFFEVPDRMGGYKLASMVDEASRKAPGKRSKFDKALLQIDERVNVAYMVYTGSLIRIWPKPNDLNNKWDATIESLQTLDPRNAQLVKMLAIGYFMSIDEALKSGDWSKANEMLSKIDQYQHFVGATVYPKESKVAIEIFYNHSNVFERLWPLYFLVGFVLLILSFVKILKPQFSMEKISNVSLVLLIVFFVVHTIGLGMRWYISGHAPWSNGYESMIYIGWATVLAGFIFSKRSAMTMAATSILTGLILFVAHLNWMDPQVTNLVPVLNSYWLSIHVSMITASYGFLGLGALLGFITLVLFALKNENNRERLNRSIQELNTINEMGLMIGLTLLTVGNFLGGVWANESWGRYWGWDPKETWALVTILVYAVVLHLRFIKGAYTQFIYSVVSLLAFTSVLMTYFGVNYYLAGLHSYAKGDPVPVPDFVPWSYAVIFILIALAYRNRTVSN